MSKNPQIVIFAMLVGILSRPVSAQDFLIIPETVNDTVGMYSTFDGSYLGDLINSAHLTSPFNAILGPDNSIYVSDLDGKKIVKYSIGGQFQGTFADFGDGVHFARGMDTRNGQLFAIDQDDVRVYDLQSGDELPNFISNTGALLDIFFLDDGRALVSDGQFDVLRLYDTDGTFLEFILFTDFPSQIRSLSNGNFLITSVNSNAIIEFDLKGNIIEQCSYASPRSVYPLDNGNLIVTSGFNITEYDPAAGMIIEIIRTGIQAQFIELVSKMSKAPGDLDGDGVVNTNDLLILFASWGGCMCCPNCSADLNGDCTVNTSDLLILFANWG